MAHEVDDDRQGKRELTFENGRPVPDEDDEDDAEDDLECEHRD